eukprot:6922891-Pyramimonas_sp.AAC.1
MAKCRLRAAQVAAVSGPTRVTASNYNIRCVTTLSYVAQYMPLPDGFGRTEAALLARLWHAAHCALP